MILPRIQGGQGVGERRGVWKEKKRGWRIGRGREGNGSCVMLCRPNYLDINFLRQLYTCNAGQINWISISLHSGIPVHNSVN